MKKLLSVLLSIILLITIVGPAALAYTEPVPFNDSDWIRLNAAVQDAAVATIVIHPAGTAANDWTTGAVYNLVITDTGNGNTINTEPIPGAPAHNPHRILVSRAVTIMAAPEAEIVLQKTSWSVVSVPQGRGAGRHFFVDNGALTLGDPSPLVAENIGMLTLDGGHTAGNTLLRGGVSVGVNGILNMYDDVTIENNLNHLGGINLYTQLTNGPIFNMFGGVIRNNTTNNGQPDLVGAGTGASGGGVQVGSSGTFNMHGGEISGNSVTGQPGQGGGVSVIMGTFIMNGGTISGNWVGGNDGHGGGVSVMMGTFTMNGGTISDNWVDNVTGTGGGVFLQGNTFTMGDDAEISGNTATGNGGGVAVVFGNFNMSGDAVISGNTTDSLGGGVAMQSGAFTMGGSAEISGNKSQFAGGGVSLTTGGVTFNMQSGTISGNTSGTQGGGVHLAAGGFTMQAGEISGNTAYRGGGIWVYPTSRSALNIFDVTLFFGNIGLAGDYNYGLAAGLAAYPNILWQGYLTGQNSIIGSHLLNNYDINSYGIYEYGNSLTVNFDGNGGYVTLDAISAPNLKFIVYYDDYVAQIPSAARDGYVFLGWSLSQDGSTGLVNPQGFLVTGDVTFYAQWGTISTPPGGGWLPPPTEPTQPTAPTDPTDPGSAVYHHAYLIGFEDGTVRPRANVTRAQVATIFFRLMSDSDRAGYWMQTNPYPDVALEQWFNNAVSTTTNAGMFIGLPDGTFQPNRAITRAELATVIARLMDVTYNGDPLFNDIAGHWAQDYINAIAHSGWVVGYEGLGGRFMPDQAITRAEAAAMINRVLERLPEGSEDLLYGMLTWPDNANETAWYYLYIQEATNSHYYEMKDDGVHETWTRLMPPRPWALLERPDSQPNDIFMIQN